ncbi:MAG: PIG-L family deacetylase [Deltaproteobacteria bacterium]|nr:PIG-L family deacetylase [Deltaproteobacteria bacterium]
MAGAIYRLVEALSPTPAYALVIVPHCDDADYYCGGMLAGWAAQGRRVVLAVLTDGAKGTMDLQQPPAELTAQRRAEQRRAAAHLGLAAVEFLAYSEGEVDNSPPLRRDLVRLIRRHRPEVVVTLDPRADAVPPGGINHPDHRNTGRATLDAIYPAAHMPTFFPELLAEGLQPHHAAEVLLAATDTADEYVDVSTTLDQKIAALREHHSQFGDGDGVAAEARFIAEWTGQRCALELAEGFRRIVNSW